MIILCIMVVLVLRILILKMLQCIIVTALNLPNFIAAFTAFDNWGIQIVLNFVLDTDLNVVSARICFSFLGLWQGTVKIVSGIILNQYISCLYWKSALLPLTSFTISTVQFSLSRCASTRFKCEFQTEWTCFESIKGVGSFTATGVFSFKGCSYVNALL